MLTLLADSNQAPLAALGLLLIAIAGALRAQYCLGPQKSELLRAVPHPLGRTVLLGVLMLPQDVAVAFQGILLASVFGSIPGVGGWAAAVSGAVLAAFVCLYLMIDQILLASCSFRLRYYFASHLVRISNYTKSAQALGVSPARLIWVPLAAMTLAFVLMCGLAARNSAPHLTFKLVCWTLAAFGAALLITRCVPSQTAFRVNNILFNEQCELVRQWWRCIQPPGAPLVPRRDFALQETFVQPLPAYPLFRQTTAYTGDLQFEIALTGRPRPHVLLLFMESFRAANIGVIGRDIPASPEFDRLSKEGVLFPNFYCNGIQTTRAVTASLFGILPRFSYAPEQSDISHLPRLRGVPRLFTELGYHAAYLHNGDLRYENQDEFCTRTGYNELVGMTEIQERFPEAENLSGWGVPDEFLMREYVDWLTRRAPADPPTFATLFTISNHHPFIIPEGFAAPAFDCNGDEEKAKFLRSFYYSDWCLGLLMRLLRERSLDENLVIFVLGDTGQPLGEHKGNYAQQAYLFEENIHIPLLILAPGRLRSPVVVPQPGSQMDLLPTFIDLFQHPFYHHAFGSSLLRRNPEHRVFFNNPYGFSLVGQRQGQWKFLHEHLGNQSYLFDLQMDPGEVANLADKWPEKVAAMHQECERVNRTFTHLYARNRFCPATPH